MDYSLGGLKLLCGHIKTIHKSPHSGYTFQAILFQRAWIQGVVVLAEVENKRLLIDDGTGIVELFLPDEFLKRQFKTGMYVMVVGGFFIRQDQSRVIKVHKIVDLSLFPDREAMWYLEVIEVHKLFYQSSC